MGFKPNKGHVGILKFDLSHPDFWLVIWEIGFFPQSFNKLDFHGQ
jgi:hypothetical protein